MELLVEISEPNFGRRWYIPTQITPEAIYIGDQKIYKEACSWTMSGVSTPHVVRLIYFPINLAGVDSGLLFDLINFFSLDLSVEFWEDRLRRDYPGKIMENRPAEVSAKEQYWALYTIKSILESPLFNRSYSDLEKKLPLEWITRGDRVDLIMSLPFNLVQKYENLKFRLKRDQKMVVLKWLHETDTRV